MKTVKNKINTNFTYKVLFYINESDVGLKTLESTITVDSELTEDMVKNLLELEFSKEVNIIKLIKE